MTTPHIEAKNGFYADTVLMPGDPLRAKWIAENFLEDVIKVNSVRNCFGYTGTYEGKKISVQASGMGHGSLGIYVHELYNFYNVKRIIRVGTCGGISKDVKVGDIVVAKCNIGSFESGEPSQAQSGWLSQGRALCLSCLFLRHSNE